MRRKAIDKRLKSIARLRTAIASSRDRLSCRLAERPAAPSVESFSYGPVLDHLQAELAAVERRLATAECAYAADQAQLTSARQTRNRRVSDLYTLQCDASVSSRSFWAPGNSSNSTCSEMRCRGLRCL